MRAAWLLLLPSLALAGLKTEPAAAPVGLVLAVQGDATVGDAPLRLGGMLQRGQSVAVADGATVVFSLITTCREVTFAGPGSIQVGDAVVLDGGKTVSDVASPGCVQASNLSLASQLTSGAVLVRGAADAGRTAPRAGRITAERRVLRWDGPLADGRGVLVSVYAGDELLLESETTGGRFELPAQVVWKPGGTYNWTAEPAGLSPGPSLDGRFEVVDAAVGTQLATMRATAAGAQDWLRIAFFCEVHLLQTDAGEAYAEAVARAPNADGAKARLLDLDLP